MSKSPSKAAKSLYIKTYGCQMNVYDSHRMADVLAPLGYRTQESPEGADMVILNTCHIREKAEEKVYSDLGRIRQEKTKRAAAGERMLIAVGGCVGQAEGAEIIRRAPYVDIVMGPQSYHELPDMIFRAEREAKGVVALDFAPQPKFDSLPQAKAAGASAFLSVQEGCDKFCTFCVVPYTRGAEYSRPAADIEKEARGLVEQGVLEITLLGQNVNAYHGESEDSIASLAQLIRRLASIDGLRRIRYTTSHPRDMSDDLIEAHAEVEALMPYLHLPVQSGSDDVLKRMNRKHTAAEYIAIIDTLRSCRPDIALSSDFIVGFPGETEEDFRATLGLVETVGYTQAYSFKYSARPGTPAANAENQIPEDIKDERLQRLQSLLNRQQAEFNARQIGTVTEVLLEKPGKKPGQWVGKNPYLQSVHVMDAAGAVGRISRVKIVSAGPYSLAGELAESVTPGPLADLKSGGFNHTITL